MSARPARAKSDRTSKTNPKRHIPIPTLVAVLASASQPQDFAKAWAAAPGLVASMLKGDEDRHYPLIRRFAGLDAILDTVEKQGPDAILARVTIQENGFLRAVALLEKDDPDLIVELETPITDAAFSLGFALACYLLSNGGAR